MIRDGLPPALGPFARRLLLGVLALSLSACATTGPDYDPYQPMNRSIHAFNEVVDEVALRPAATLYDAVVPDFVSQAIGNVFANLRDMQSVPNDLLQGKVSRAFEGTLRVGVNSTLGLGGLVDVGTSMGLERSVEDFGQTMGVWGVETGPYLVLPLHGPSNVRDALGAAVDIVTDPLLLIPHRKARYGAAALRLVDDRARLLDTDLIVGAAAIDKYSYLRDAYLQHRQHRVHDGHPPEREAIPPESEE